ncbi:MAG: type III pantothenate kinase [bacterium]
MLLAVDVGNTNIVLGLFDGEKLLSFWRLHTDSRTTTDEFTLVVESLLKMAGFSFQDVQGMAVACVVPPLIHPLTRFAERHLKLSPLIVGPGTKTGMPILIDNPKELGADLIVNAVAAKEKFGAPVIVVDFGTATTFSAVSPKGEYLGGVIAPGVKMALDGLFLQTAKLPKVEIVEPSQAIGKNTVTAIQSGIFFGFVGLAREIINRLKEEIGVSCPVIATGGLSGMIARRIPEVDYLEPQLTLEGLRLIFERNQKK